MPETIRLVPAETKLVILNAKCTKKDILCFKCNYPGHLARQCNSNSYANKAAQIQLNPNTPKLEEDAYDIIAEETTKQQQITSVNNNENTGIFGGSLLGNIANSALNSKLHLIPIPLDFTENHS